MRDILPDVSVIGEVSLSVPEHQTLVSWTDDEQSEQFGYWLHLEGFAQFKEWYDNQKEDI